MHSTEETITIAWCDPSTVESPFMSSVIALILRLQQRNIILYSVTHRMGNEIFRQRQDLLDSWYENETADWLLWLDSDIIITPDIFDKLWDVADKDEFPVITGVYMTYKDTDGVLRMPFPCIFQYDEKEEDYKSIHPLPDNSLVQVDAAGMGLLLIHRSVIDALYKVYKKGNLFDVSLIKPIKSEDISFFEKLREQSISVFAHTGAIARHIKKVYLDKEYYEHWWTQFGNK